MKKSLTLRPTCQASAMRTSLIVRPLLQARWALLPAALVPFVAMGNPSGGTVVAGEASITGGAGLTTITQQSTLAVIEWQKFGIDPSETVNFMQPSASAAILNRITGNDPSEIFGSLTSNGRVFLVNPHGVMFGAGSSIDVGSLVASTLDISKDDFMAGRYVLVGNSTPAAVSNDGTITARSGGFVVLSGGEVSNGGSIDAPQGDVVLASGAGLSLDLDDVGLISYRIDAAALSDVAGVINTGKLSADGGRVFMAANVARSLAATAVNNSGSVRATSIGEQDGVIVLEALGGDIHNSSTLSATSQNGMGGSIQVLGDHDVLITAGKLDTSGNTGSGGIEIAAGRDVQISGNLTSGGGDIKIRASVGQNLQSSIGSITQSATSTITLGGGNLDLGKAPDDQHTDFGALGNILLQGSIMGAHDVSLSTGYFGNGLRIDVAPNQGNLSVTGSITAQTENGGLTIARDVAATGSITLNGFGSSADVTTRAINAGSLVQILASGGIATGAIDTRSTGPGISSAALLLAANNDITVNGTISTNAATTQGNANGDSPVSSAVTVDSADASVYVFSGLGNIKITGDITTAATVTATPLAAGDTPTASTNVAQANASVTLWNGDTADQSITIGTAGIHTSAIAYGVPSTSVDGNVISTTSADAGVEIRTDYLNDETPDSFSGSIMAGGTSGIITLAEVTRGGVSNADITAAVLGGGITINGPVQTSADGYVDLLTRPSTTQPSPTPPATTLPPPVLAQAAGDIVLNGAVGSETLAPVSVRIESGAALRIADIYGGTVSLSSVGDIDSSAADGHLTVTSLTVDAPPDADTSNTGNVTIQANNGAGSVRGSSITVDAANRMITSGLFDTTLHDAASGQTIGLGSLALSAGVGTATINTDTLSSGDVSFRDDAGEFIGSVDFVTGALSVTARAINNTAAINLTGDLNLQTTAGALTTSAVTSAGDLELRSFAGIQTGDLQGGNLFVLSGDTGGITTGNITATVGDIVLFAPISGGPALDLNLGHLSASSGEVTIFAGGVNSTTEIDSITAAGNVVVDTFADGDFYALTRIGAIESGANVDIGTLLQTHVVNLTTVTAAGNITVQAGSRLSADSLRSTGGNVDLLSNGDIAISGASSEAGGNINLTSAAGNITATGSYDTSGNIQMLAESGLITLDNSSIEGNLTYLSADRVFAAEAVRIDVAALSAAGRILDFSGAAILVGQGEAPMSNDFGLIDELTQQGLSLPGSLIPNANFDATESLVLASIGGSARYIALRAPVASLPNFGTIGSTAGDLFLHYAPTDNAADFTFDLAQLSFANSAATFAFGSSDYLGSIFITDPSTGIVQNADKAVTGGSNNTSYIFLSEGTTFGASALQAATSGQVVVLGPEAQPPTPPPPSPAPPTPAPPAPAPTPTPTPDEDPFAEVSEQNLVLLTDQLAPVEEKKDLLVAGPEISVLQDAALVTRDSTSEASQQCNAI